MVLSMLLVLLFPFINLLGLVTAYATICLLSQQAISQASKQQNYPDALKSLKEESSQLLNSPFAAFAKVTPIKGYKNCGSDLYVEATNFLDSSTKTFGPNTPVPPPLDPQTFVYEYSIRSSFEAQPLISMSKIPLLSEIPGLGKPYILNYHCTKSVEHVKGLAFNPGLTTAYVGGSMNFPGPLLQTQGPRPTQADVGGWNHPDIYEAIKAAGQKVLAQDVVIVHANNAYWTPTNIEVPPGSKVWIDYRADGEWSTMPARGTCDANGDWIYVDSASGARNICGSKYGYDGVMLGKVGENGKASFFGKQQWNKPLNGTGKLYLGAYDQWAATVERKRAIESGNSSHIYYQGFEYSEDPEPEYVPLSKDGDPPLQDYKENTGTMEVRVVIAK
jgi:hypothetical protein